MKIELKKFEDGFAESIAKYANNKKVADNLRNAFPHPYTLEEAYKFIETCKKNDEKKDIVRAIVADGEFIGTVGVFIKDDVYSLSAEIGYWLAEPFWGKGIMTKCVKDLCEYVFENYGIIRIFTEIFAYNTGSKRVLEKAGFQFEGTRRKAILKNGVIYDSLAYALIKEDNLQLVEQLKIEDLKEALSLVLKTFMEFEAPDYTEDGVGEFKKFIEYDKIKTSLLDRKLFMWAFKNDNKITGVIAGSAGHINLLFVDKNYQRQGIARRLFKEIYKFSKESGANKITVNSSPYAVEVYKKFGFTQMTNEEQIKVGIRFYPMKLEV